MEHMAASDNLNNKQNYLKVKMQFWPCMMNLNYTFLHNLLKFYIFKLVVISQVLLIFNWEDQMLITAVVNNHLLEKVDSTTFLGIYVDKSLSRDSHIGFISKMISSRIFLFRYLSRHCKPFILIMAYFGLVFWYHFVGFLFRI